LRSGGNAEEFFETRAVALGAMGFFIAADEQLEVGRTVGAVVFVEGHDKGSRL